MLSRALLATLCALQLGCIHVRYLEQAAYGQLELLDEARPIAEVLADPDTHPRTRMLLAEVPRIKEYAREVGMEPSASYEKYVALSTGAVVWVVSASRPLAFENKTWAFPFFGAFPFLGWFDYFAAAEFGDELADKGWDVDVRPAGAYSTLGILPDPILSSMLSAGDEAFGLLVNVVLHESVHATVYIRDQSVFNESMASFVAERLTPGYLACRFGESSVELATYLEVMAAADARARAILDAYRELDGVYASDLSDAAKLAKKREILAVVDAATGFMRPPTNATLLQYKTYGTGMDDFANLLAACSDSWECFFGAVDSLESDDFAEPLSEDIAGVLEPLIARLRS